MVNLNLHLLVLLITLEQFICIVPRKTLLTVYYESNCPDSRTFILKQLQPAHQLLQDHFTIKFFPFGKSRSINFGDGGFECQHGSAECLGNMVQDCTLNQMKENPDKDKLAYVACEMETQAGSRGILDEFMLSMPCDEEKLREDILDQYILETNQKFCMFRTSWCTCVEKLGQSTRQVKECVSSGDGTILQLESEYYTNLVKPSFIPTITINNEFNQDIQNTSQVDLIATLCSVLGEIAPCARYYNYLALNDLLFT